MNGDKFHYTYTAPNERERREIESIRRQYAKKGEEDGLARLRKLNRRATRPPLAAAIALGTVGALVFGLGMAMAVEWNMIASGSAVGAVGLALAASAYPLYKLMLNRNRRKFGRQIVELSDGLLNGKEGEK